MNNHNKIVYFDKETISNLLQESNKGSISTSKKKSSTLKSEIKAEVESKIHLEMPFTKRLSFLFSGRLSTSYIKQIHSETSITSTDISEFQKIKEDLKAFSNVQVRDIEKSSTFFRVAGGYLNMVKGNIDGVDVKEFNLTMQGFEGYDTYKIEEKTYVRFNNTSFVSNYKRNDLLTTKLVIICMHVGTFKSKDFDFLHQISKMEKLMSNDEYEGKLSDKYPIGDDDPTNQNHSEDENKSDSPDEKLKEENITNQNTIELYDVLYASIYRGQNE